MFNKRTKFTIYKLMLNSMFLFLLLIMLFISPLLQATELETTDEYLQGLDEEISSPEYLSNAKRELIETEKREINQRKLSPKAISALSNLAAFENLLKTEYPASHNIYSRLASQTRFSIFKKYQETKKLSIAKRMIIESYLESVN